MEINKKTHLLFTFSSVECKEPKKGELSKTVFGYAFLPLMDKQNNLIDTSLTFDIPVAKELLGTFSFPPFFDVYLYAYPGSWLSQHGVRGHFMA